MKREINSEGEYERSYIYTALETEPCTVEHFGSNVESFLVLELENMRCIKKNQPGLKEISIEGKWEGSVYENVMIDIYPCTEKTSNATCGTKDEINMHLRGAYFSFYFTRIGIDPRNYDSPDTHYLSSFYTLISNTYFKEIPMMLNLLQVKTDEGWLTNDIVTRNYVQYERTDELVDMRPSEAALSFILRSGDITTIYERSYIKIQDILAQASGLINAGIFVLLIALHSYSTIKFYEELINELFHYKKPGKDVFHSKKQGSRQKKKNKLIFSRDER